MAGPHLVPLSRLSGPRGGLRRRRVGGPHGREFGPAGRRGAPQSDPAHGSPRALVRSGRTTAAGAGCTTSSRTSLATSPSCPSWRCRAPCFGPALSSLAGVSTSRGGCGRVVIPGVRRPTGPSAGTGRWRSATTRITRSGRWSSCPAGVRSWPRLRSVRWEWHRMLPDVVCWTEKWLFGFTVQGNLRIGPVGPSRGPGHIPQGTPFGRPISRRFPNFSMECTPRSLCLAGVEDREQCRDRTGWGASRTRVLRKAPA